MIKALDTFNLYIKSTFDVSGDYWFELLTRNDEGSIKPIYWIKTKQYVFSDKLLLGRELKKGEYLFGLKDQIGTYPK